MKRLLSALLALSLVSCTAMKPAPAPSPVSEAPPQNPTTLPDPSVRIAKVELGKSLYYVRLPEGASDRLLWASTPYGVAWISPQPETGEQLGKHPTTAAKLFVTPYRANGGDLELGAQELFTFPLTIEKEGIDRYLSVVSLVSSGEWVITVSSLHALGAAQSSGRLDAVHPTTKEHRYLTDAKWAGGNFFDWRAEGGRVYWLQQRSTNTGTVEEVESVVVDLQTGEKQNVPPSTVKGQ